jgi:acylphosphatase
VKAFQVKVSGRVQGVCFRLSTREEAKRIGVTGWVRNLSDGSVLVFMQGSEEKVNSLLSWCYQGPAGASVASINYVQRPVDPSIRTFSIKY